MVKITKKEKLINKIRNNPKNVKFEELDKILTIPYKRPYIKVIYIKKAIKLLEELGY